MITNRTYSQIVMFYIVNPYIMNQKEEKKSTYWQEYEAEP